MTESRGQGFADVLVAGAAQRDLIASPASTHDARRGHGRVRRAQRPRRRPRRAAAGPSALPSGRQTYRTYEDIQAELKELVEEHPDTRAPVVIGKTFQGRDIQGVEIANNVNANDGRPTFFLMGLHHAREWPSEEAAMEYATMLADPDARRPRRRAAARPSAR